MDVLRPPANSKATWCFSGPSTPGFDGFTSKHTIWWRFRPRILSSYRSQVQSGWDTPLICVGEGCRHEINPNQTREQDVGDWEACVGWGGAPRNKQTAEYINKNFKNTKKLSTVVVRGDRTWARSPWCSLCFALNFCTPKSDLHPYTYGHTIINIHKKLNAKNKLTTTFPELNCTRETPYFISSRICFPCENVYMLLGGGGGSTMMCWMNRIQP